MKNADRPSSIANAYGLFADEVIQFRFSSLVLFGFEVHSTIHQAAGRSKSRKRQTEL